MQGTFTAFLAQAAILLPAFMISLSFHEWAHAFIATRFGDDTPRKMGRLTLNPLAHIDPLGLIFLLLFRIGWAKPVVFDQRNFKYPRIYSVLTALAGPASNFILALATLYLIKYFPISLVPTAVSISFLQLLQVTAYVNIMLGCFNILPIPPLDGSHILTALLIKPFPEAVAWLYRYSIFILLGIFLLPQTRILLIQMIQIVETFLLKLVI